MEGAREKEILEGIVKVLREELSPVRIILFGSRGKGSNHYSSDFDIAVDCEEFNPKTRLTVEDRIRVIRGLYRVDIIHLGSVEKDFRKIIEQTGKVLYER